MSWKQLNLIDSKINMSKVTPFDAELSTLDKKQAYYHNNRLTALKKYTTDYAVGYKCYKRQANSEHLVDNELTDYIEINKLTESGALIHVMDVADTYYKSELATTEDSSSAPEFIHGVILDDSYIGSVAEWAGYSFYRVNADEDYYLAYNSVADSLKYIRCLKHKYSDVSKNCTIRALGTGSDKALFYFRGWTLVVDKAAFDRLYAMLSYEKVQKNIDVKSQYGAFVDTTNPNNIYNAIPAEFPEVSFPCYRVGGGWFTEGTFDLKCYNKLYGGDGKLTPNSSIFHIDYYAFDLIYDIQVLDTYYLYLENQYHVGERYWYDEKYHTGTMHALVGTTGKIRYIKNNKLVTEDFSASDKANDNNEGPINVKFKVSIDGYTRTSISSDRINYEHLGPVTFEASATADGIDSTSTTVNDFNYNRAYSPMEETLTTNYQNDSVITDNGFVVNYTNKLPVSLGHKYKIIARLDTQGSSYLGSDNTYSYISQNGKIYRISLASMFPDIEYDQEVNIINSDYCMKVGAYKIFNTTTYYNAVYNDDPDKVICSCDDWNGRYYSTSNSDAEPSLLSTSRVGHFWDSTQSYEDIPCKTISDELSDIMEFAQPVYHWANPQYTMHEGTKAYIYTAASELVDSKHQYYEVTKTGFVFSEDVTKPFSHKSPVELVPSILFTSFLKSAVVNIIQIGSEAYELLNYSYSTTVPALVYQEEAVSINIDPTSQEMVIQGAYYTISGASSARRILNPYDTSSSTYCCDVTGLRYLGYDSEQGYFYSPATGVIYTFNGANKLNAFIEVDKRTPLESGIIGGEEVGINVTNIPSMNIIAMAFTDGVLVICNGQSVFIECQSVNEMEASKEYGLIRINGSYYYFGTNNTITGLIEDAQQVTVDFNIKSSKIGFDRLTNQTCQKHRLIIYADTLDATHKAEVTVTLTGVLGNRPFVEKYQKIINANELLDNEYQWEFNPKNTKSMYFQTEVTMKNADLLEYWMDINDSAEENLTRH